MSCFLGGGIDSLWRTELPTVMRSVPVFVARSGAACLLLIFVPSPHNATAQELVPTRFHVAGNAIVDPSGNEVVFRGVNPQDPIWQALCGDSDMMPWQEEQFEEIAERGANIVRLSIFPGSWRQFGQARSLEVMDQFIAWAARHGLYVLVDMHSIGFPPTEQYEVDTDDCFSALGGEIYRTTQDEIIAFWPESVCRSCSGLYRSDLISFLEARSISWTVWSFSDTWGPTLLSDKSYTPTESGAFFRTAMQSSGPARALTGEQRSCVNAINKAGAAIMKAHGQADVKCVRNAADGEPIAGGSVAACVTTELGARVVRSLAKLGAQDARRCQAKPGQLPGFGYAGAATVSKAALAASRDLVTDLYGPDLNAAIVSAGADPGGATCQRVVLAGVTGVLDRLWRLARKAKKKAMAAKGAAAVTSAAGLTEAIGTSIDLDASGQLAKEIASLASSTTQACSSGATATPLPQLFAGRCSVSADAEALAACAAELARCRFCVALKEFDVLAADCDDFDNALVQDTSSPCCIRSSAPITLPARAVGPQFKISKAAVRSRPKR